MIITKTTRVLVAGVVLAGASRVTAQGPPPRDDRAVVTVNVGAQPQRRDFETGASFTVFDETATIRRVSTSATVRSSTSMEVDFKRRSAKAAAERQAI